MKSLKSAGILFVKCTLERFCLFTCWLFTHQSAKPLWWVSTGDPWRVNSDLHELFHVHWGGLTWIQLPSGHCSQVGTTHVILATELRPTQRRREEENEGQERVGLAAKSHFRHSDVSFISLLLSPNLLQTSGCHGY